MVSVGIEEGIKFIFCMSLFMCSLLAESEFIGADNESREYRYIYSMLLLSTTQQWIG